jgi:hypothetical protein
MAMTETAAERLEFRAAFPDESGRAAFLDPRNWENGDCHWWLALIAGPPERIVGAVRYSCSANGIDFRLVRGPGGELAGREAALLEDFLAFCRRFSPAEIRYVDSLEDEAIDDLLAAAGFEVIYCEQRFETRWAETQQRVSRIFRSLDGRPSPLAIAEVVPVRDLEMKQAQLVISLGLMREPDLRGMWHSPDPTRFDRDLSACLVLDGQTLGVVLCADAGSHLRILAIAGRDDFPGARRRAVPLLMDHVFRSAGARGYEGFLFRANVENARQTVNLAHRLGGRIIGEIRRRGRKL